ncbi:MAG TPA: pyridoxal phosphate-dependent aminotransferase family protein [Verrucomicrobiae bacterium]|nr:pyridoxal phosphate-dependent aminotransferase family protein [Verrucomicrobiae bacterium]
MTALEPLQQLGRSRVRWRGRELIYFSGCDYFRMAENPAVLKAVAGGLKKYGLNVAASRLTTGHHKIYETLEGELAKFFQVQNALLVSTGYLTGIIVGQALAGTFSHALLDARAHPALIDAANQLDCPILKFAHRNADDFARAIKRCGKGARPILLTDGMFSHDGSIAPLKSYLKHLPSDGMILVDDAHGAGVLGKNGRGTPEHENVSRGKIIQCITLSKAFGVFGGAILATRELREKILQRSRSFVGSTPVPLPLANAALASLKVFRSRGASLRRRLCENAQYVKDSFEQTGSSMPKMPGPIIPVHTQTDRESLALKKHLLAAGIFPPFLKYPGGDANGYFRFVISSEHTRVQLDTLVKSFQNFSESRNAH